MPPILRLILRDLVNRQPDMAVVGEVKTLAELLHALASLRARPLKFAGIALLLTGISLALAAIRKILQFQAGRILEIVSGMGR